MNENQVKQKNSKGLIVLVILLLIVIIGLVSYIVYDKISNENTDKKVIETKKEDNEVTKENKKEENKIEDDNKQKIEDNNKEELLKEINNAYESAYNYINSGIDVTKDFSNDPKLKTYFTDKAINRISKNGGMSLTSILSSMDQGKRPLSIVSYNDDTIVAKGQLVKGDPNTMYDADEYPLYIIFKKENNTYKIDMFE